MNNLAIPELDTLPIMAYKGVPIVTTTMLATYYGCSTKHLRDGYQRHRDRFHEGTHVIPLDGSDLADFRSSTAICGSQFAPGIAARKILLWTKRGALRHAKLLNTDKAWEVFEEMEDCYFNRMAQPQKPAQAALPTPPPAPETIELSLRDWAEMQKERGDLLAFKLNAVEGNKRPKRTCRPVSEAEGTAIVEAVRGGLSCVQTAKRFNRSTGTVSYLCRLAGLPKKTV